MEMIGNWRAKVLGAVADRISAGDNASRQAELGIWHHGGDIPYPSRADLKISDECLIFGVNVANSKVLFSVWIMIGEVRIGAKIPAALVGTSQIRERVSCVYDGEKCQRTSQIGDEFMFDWIWRDKEFASFDFMTSAINSEMHTSVIVDRMSQVLTHLFLAITAALLDSHKLSASRGHISKEATDVYQLIVIGEIDVLTDHVVRKLSGSCSKPEQGAHGYSVTVFLPKGAGVGSISAEAVIRDQDGSVCRVLKFETVKKAV